MQSASSCETTSTTMGVRTRSEFSLLLAVSDLRSALAMQPELGDENS